MSIDIFKPCQLGDLTLLNRIVMAPMTRNRADKNGVPTPMMVTHYVQRASAGLIITESTTVSTQAIGYPLTPGLYTEEQVAGWRKITDAVHAVGGHIFVQLQHCGRISHPSMQLNNATPVSASAIQPEGQAFTYTGLQDFVTPRSLETHEIQDVVAQFRHAADMAKRAGFDGIELHGANGYIIDQFLRDGSNHRTDQYGGSPQNRMLLLNEILDAVCTVWPSHRIGVRLSPENSFNSMSDSNPQQHFEYFIGQLTQRNLAFVHILEGDMMTKNVSANYREMRFKFTGPYIANNGYDLARAQTVLRNGDADLVAFGIPFIANPDLVRRLREKLPLAQADSNTFYGGGEAGYTDYPTYHDERQIHT